MSRQEILVLYLQLSGCQEVKARGWRFRRFTCAKDPAKFYFVGRHGACRMGKSVFSSVSLTGAVDFKRIKTIVSAVKGVSKC